MAGLSFAGMRRVWKFLDPAALLLAGGVLALLAGAGVVAWRAAGSGETGEGISVGALVVGQLMLGLVVATVAAIAWAAGIAPGSPRAGVRTWVGVAILALAIGVWLSALAGMTGRLGVGEVGRVWLLFAAWLALWTAAGVVLRPLGAARAVVIAGVPALVLLALPVAITPGYRAVLAAWGAGATETLSGWMAQACPTLGVIAAIWDSAPFVWPQRPVMYGLTPLGQDFPMPLPAWGIQTMGFAWVAAALAAAPFAWRWLRGLRGLRRGAH